MAVISTSKTCALILGMLGAIGTVVAARAPVERFGNGATTAWAGSLTYVPSWLDPDPAMAGGRSVMPVPPRSPVGSLPFTLGFQPNGDGVEVDAPTDIAYSPDGQYILVPAKGKGPNVANLSVYSATDLAPIRVIPLTHAPEAFALMVTQPRAVLVNPDDDTVTVVDYEAGVELAVIPVGDLPSAVAVSPNDAVAVVQGDAPYFSDESEVSWSIIDLATNTETARLAGPVDLYTRLTVNAPYGLYGTRNQPVFRPDGDEVAVLRTDPAIGGLGLSILDVATQARTEVAIASGVAVVGRAITATPDNSVIALAYQDADDLDIHVARVETTNWAVQDFHITTAPFPVDGLALSLLLKSDGNRIAVNDGVETLWVLDTTTGVAIPADTSGFPYSYTWLPVADLGNGANFLLWNQGNGDDGYQVFDWSGNHVTELISPELGVNDVIPYLLAHSPTDPFQVAFADPVFVGEDLVLLDLDPSDPQVLVHSQVGDGGIEGDAAIKVSLSADQSTALVLNGQSSNAFFLDMQTMARGWIVVPKYVTDAALLPDGDTAMFISGAPFRSTPPIINAARLTLIDRVTGAASDVPLPDNTYGRALALDSVGDYAYTLLGNPDLPDSELARIDLTTQQIDPVRLQVPLGLGRAPFFFGFDNNVLPLMVNLNDSDRWFAQSHDGEILAVASMAQDQSDSHITLIDRDDWSVVSSVSLEPGGAVPYRIEFSPDDSRLYVVSQQAVSLVAVDGANSTLVQQRPIETIPPQLPWFLTDLVLSPDGSKLYVGVQAIFDPVEMGYEVWVLEPDTLENIATIEFAVQDDLGFPAFFWWGGNAPAHLRWSEDGTKLYAFSLSGDVHAIDPLTDQVIASMDTGFRAPTSVVPLADDSRGAGEQFLMASFNSANDGIALLTIEEPVVDVIFESGFEQD